MKVVKEKDNQEISYLLSFGNAKYSVEYNLSDLVEVATTVKDFGFYEEQEWRLVSWNNPKAKEKTDNNHRYIEFDFDPAKWIIDIVVSPHGDKEKIRKVLDYYQDQGVLSKNCVIKESKIPFRG